MATNALGTTDAFSIVKILKEFIFIQTKLYSESKEDSIKEPENR